MENTTGDVVSTEIETITSFDGVPAVEKTKDLLFFVLYHIII